MNSSGKKVVQKSPHPHPKTEKWHPSSGKKHLWQSGIKRHEETDRQTDRDRQRQRQRKDRQRQAAEIDGERERERERERDTHTHKNTHTAEREREKWEEFKKQC